MLSRVIPVVFVTALAFSGQAQAASTYLLQLGQAPTREEAEEIYKSAMDSHAGVLSEYGYIIKESPRAAPEKRVRVQVGPLTNRKTANRICADLRAADTACFVVETASKAQVPAAVAKTEPVTPEPAPQAKTESSIWDIFGGSEEKTEAAPVAAIKEEPKKFEPVQEKKVAAAAPSKQININTSSVRQMEAPEVPEIDLFGSISSLFGDEEPKADEPKEVAALAPAAPPVETPTRQGRVEVAEAIPVPLEKDAIAEPMPKLAVVEQPSKPQAVLAKLVRNKKQRAGTVLQIGTFTDGPSALGCWDQIASAEPAAKKLKAKAITGTSGSIGLPRATLRIEPITEDLKTRVCELASMCGDDISCRTPGSDAVVEAPLPSPTAEAKPSEPPPLGGFWVQLGAFPSYAHAQSHFEELKDTQGDITGPYEAVIRAPVNSRAKTYRLRIGPFETQSEAEKLCWKLAARGVDCVAISE